MLQSADDIINSCSSTADVADAIRDLTDLIAGVESASMSEVVLPLYHVDCRPLRKALITRARTIVVALLEGLRAQCILQLQQTDARAQELLQQLQSVPTGPEELLALRATVAANPEHQQAIAGPGVWGVLLGLCCVCTHHPDPWTWSSTPRPLPHPRPLVSADLPFCAHRRFPVLCLLSSSSSV